jgi:hypothetical protein
MFSILIKTEKLKLMLVSLRRVNILVFGRIVIAQFARGQGLGGKLIREILQLCAERWPRKKIKIEAQEQVVELYKKYGFEAVGQPFLFESTPHLTMVYNGD